MPVGVHPMTIHAVPNRFAYKMAVEMGDEAYEKAGRPFTYKLGLEKSLAAWKAKK